MKKFFYVLAVAAALAACKKNEEEQKPEEKTPTEPTSLQITATNPFGWAKADKVSILDGKSNNMFRSQGAGKTATLAGDAIPVKPLYGFAPYDEAAALNGTAVAASVPTAQVLTAGKTAGVVAGIAEDGQNMTFTAVTGFVKINLAADAEEITAISVASTNGEAIAGAVEVSFSGNTATVTPKSETATVSATAFEEVFKAGASYNVAVLPGTYAGGITVYYTFKGAVNEIAVAGPVVVKAGETVELTTIDRPLTAVEKLLIGEWELVKWGSGSWSSTNLATPVPEACQGDVIKFNKNGTVAIDLGSDGMTFNVTDQATQQVSFTGEETWALAENETVLKLSGNAFPLILGNANGLKTDYTINSISPAELVLQYLYTDSEGTPDIPFKIFLQPKGMKRFAHSVVPGDFGIANVDGEGVVGEGGLQPLVKDGISITMEAINKGGNQADFGWFGWGAMRIGLWSGDGSIKSVTFRTSSIKGNIKAVTVDIWNNEEFNDCADFVVTVGGQPFGSKGYLKGVSTPITASSSEPASGEIVITATNISENDLAFILRTIEIVYQD